VTLRLIFQNPVTNINVYALDTLTSGTCVGVLTRSNPLSSQPNGREEKQFGHVRLLSQVAMALHIVWQEIISSEKKQK